MLRSDALASVALKSHTLLNHYVALMFINKTSPVLLILTTQTSLLIARLVQKALIQQRWLTSTDVTCTMPQ